MTIEEGIRNNPALYQQRHKWVYSVKGKANNCYFGAKHKSSRYEWANISGKYIEDIHDWISLCPSCHRKFDFTEETRRNLSRSHKGIIPSWLTRKVSKLSPKGKILSNYSSIAQAAKENNILHTSIANVLSGRSKTAGGYLWI